MRKYFNIIVVLTLGMTSCGKKGTKVPDKEYPKVVSFTYNGSTTEYNVIKKDYSIDANGNQLTENITKLWLDRNLGASRVATSISDSQAFGDLFQWGRLADGHQLRTSDTVETLANNINPNHNNFIVNLLGTIWLTNNNDSLWNNPNNTNCSCPNGWRVPTAEELKLEMNSWTTKDITGAFNSPLKWTSGGDRDNHGTIRYANEWAFIWSSTPITTMGSSAYNLSIIGSNTVTISSSPKVYGLSVRCIKDY